jgi:competence protein ComEC
VWALGARRLEWLAITHPDVDHAGGAASVARDLTPREVWEGVPVPASRPRAALQQTMATSGGVWRQLSAGHVIEVAGARLEVMHPLIPDWERPRPRNDDSLVLRLRYGAIEVWLTGDAGTEFESRVEPAAASGVLRVLKVGHHGSRTSTSAAFLRALAPDIAIISAGRSNTFGHPTPEVLARLAAQGVRVLRTDRDGAVMLETDGETIDVRAFGGARWTVGRWPRPQP